MEKIAYFDCFSGISGDMAVAALLDAGATIEPLLRVLESLPIEKPELKVEKVTENGISGTRFTVLEPSRTEERNYADIKKIIKDAKISRNAKRIASKILFNLAEAEAKIHSIPLKKVQFHELGAIDTITDILGVAIFLEELGIGEVWSSKVPAGSGEVSTEHGVLPVPAPATLEILKGVPLDERKHTGEVTTPTGAAVIKSLASKFIAPGNLVVEKIGYGFGHFKRERPNFLRVIIGTKARIEESLFEVRANIDDSTAEMISETVNSLLEKGALDAWVEQALMKKGRPGVILSFLCSQEDLDRLIDEVFRGTSTIGIRFHSVERRVLPRRIEAVDTPYGQIRVKVSGTGKKTKIAAEFDDCVQLASKFGLPVDAIKREAEYRCALRLGLIEKEE